MPFKKLPRVGDHTCFIRDITQNCPLRPGLDTGLPACLPAWLVLAWLVLVCGMQGPCDPGGWAPGCALAVWSCFPTEQESCGC